MADSNSISLVSLRAGAPTVYRPPRFTILNIDTGELIEAMYNPDEIKEKLEAAYTELEIAGHSHQPMQYKNTKNFALNFELALDDLSAESKQLDDARRFLHSLFYPQRSASIGQAGTPNVLLVWPKVFAVRCRAATLEGSLKRFASGDGRLTWYVAATSWKEVLLRKLYSEDVRQGGTLRG